MSITVQEFLANATQKAADDLEAALLRIPEDKRGWSPAETSRSALDQVAECAMLNGSAVGIITSCAWPEKYDMGGFMDAKADLARDWNAVQALLHENTARVAETIRSVPDEDLGVVVQFPWGPSTLAEVAAYPYWNMSYHHGQINYIASILGCL